MRSLNLESRARLHAALGEPTRLAIADDLRVSDRSPKEIADRLGIATNLLAHHLDVLEDAGAIDRPKSAGDGRRRYVRLLPGVVEFLGSVEQPPVRDVLFLCTRNSARSQLAAALWRARTGRSARSAGTRPADCVSPGAVAAAHRAGASLEGAVPTALDRIPRGVQVITVCDLVHEELEPAGDWWHWSIPAPSASRRAGAFDVVVAELNERMSRLGLPESARKIERKPTQ